MLTFKQKAWQVIRYTTIKNRTTTRNVSVLFIFENPSPLHEVMNTSYLQEVIQITKTCIQRGHDKKRLLLWTGSNTRIKVFHQN